MTDADFPYPMWVVICEDCGPVCTVWEKPGTACSYIDHCPDCGLGRAYTKKVEDKDEHTAAMNGETLEGRAES